MNIVVVKADHENNNFNTAVATIRRSLFEKIAKNSLTTAVLNQTTSYTDHPAVRLLIDVE